MAIHRVVKLVCGFYEKNFYMSTSQPKIIFFESVLSDFFEKAGREHLPWRREGISAYEVWVSEVMLQQTQVSRVILYYTKFLERFPNIHALACVSWEEFLPYYAGLGYYGRGRNMLRAAKRIAEEFDGEFPNNVHALGTLPGIGKYTAAAIASFAYGRNELAWDTNLRRVVGRFFFGTKNTDEDVLKKIGEKCSHNAKTLNAALMDFGSAICTGRPKCGACPLAPKCRYGKERGKREMHMKNEKLKMKNEEVGGERGQLTTNDRQQTTTNKRYDGAETVRERGRVWREARVEVTLHENHTKYFSSAKQKYRPFFLPASHNTRAGIKSWFRDRYGLEVSVRPPRKKSLVEDVPTLFVNAQILSGTHTFPEFPREATLR